MDRRPPHAPPSRLRTIAAPRPRALAALAVLALALCACSGGPPDHQLRADFARLQASGTVPAQARVERFAIGDGWSDGVEIEAYYCLPAAAAEDCQSRNIGLSYRKLQDGWQMFAVQAEQAVE